MKKTNRLPSDIQQKTVPSRVQDIPVIQFQGAHSSNSLLADVRRRRRGCTRLRSSGDDGQDPWSACWNFVEQKRDEWQVSSGGLQWG